MKRPTLTSLVSLAFLAALPAIAADLNPPVSNEAPGQSVSVSLRASAEFRCFQETQARDKANWNKPTTHSNDYRILVRPWRDTAEMALEQELAGHSVKFFLGLDANGVPLNEEPRIETTLPNFERDYRPLLLQVFGRMEEAAKGARLSELKDVGQRVAHTQTNICKAMGLAAASRPSARTLVKGTLDLGGRSSALLEYTGTQACLENGVRVNIELNSWEVRDQLSGLPVSSGVRFEAFEHGSRALRIDQFTECSYVGP